MAQTYAAENEGGSEEDRLCLNSESDEEAYEQFKDILVGRLTRKGFDERLGKFGFLPKQSAESKKELYDLILNWVSPELAQELDAKCRDDGPRAFNRIRLRFYIYPNSIPFNPATQSFGPWKGDILRISLQNHRWRGVLANNHQVPADAEDCEWNEYLFDALDVDLHPGIWEEDLKQAASEEELARIRREADGLALWTLLHAVFGGEARKEVPCSSFFGETLERSGIATTYTSSYVPADWRGREDTEYVPYNQRGRGYYNNNKGYNNRHYNYNNYYQKGGYQQQNYYNNDWGNLRGQCLRQDYYEQGDDRRRAADSGGAFDSRADVGMQQPTPIVDTGDDDDAGQDEADNGAELQVPRQSQDRTSRRRSLTPDEGVNTTAPNLDRTEDNLETPEAAAPAAETSSANDSGVDLNISKRKEMNPKQHPALQDIYKHEKDTELLATPPKEEENPEPMPHIPLYEQRFLLGDWTIHPQYHHHDGCGKTNNPGGINLPLITEEEEKDCLIRCQELAKLFIRKEYENLRSKAEEDLAKHLELKSVKLKWRREMALFEKACSKFNKENDRIYDQAMEQLKSETGDKYFDYHGLVYPRVCDLWIKKYKEKPEEFLSGETMLTKMKDLDRLVLFSTRYRRSKDFPDVYRKFLEETNDPSKYSPLNRAELERVYQAYENDSNIHQLCVKDIVLRQNSNRPQPLPTIRKSEAPTTDAQVRAVAGTSPTKVSQSQSESAGGTSGPQQLPQMYKLDRATLPPLSCYRGFDPKAASMEDNVLFAQDCEKIYPGYPGAHMAEANKIKR